MKVSDLDFSYPESLVALKPEYPPRILLCHGPEAAQEISWSNLKNLFQAGDVLVINNTKVLKRRVFALDGSEILFLQSSDECRWEVLFPARQHKVGNYLELPGGVNARLEQKGLPQILHCEQQLDAEYFLKHGEMPLPPYIQKARGERHNVGEDESWYQTAWAEKPGSMAAPTASLHFKAQDLAELKAKGVEILEITLHVGLGTFLPVKVEDLSQHQMHAEMVEVSRETWGKIQHAKKSGKSVWALGTTVVRSLESAALGLLSKQEKGFFGETRLLIKPGFQFQVVDRLLTNFHQPKSTLLALVAAFAGLEYVHQAYSYAIDKKFRLFSYGDLSVWIKNQR